MNKLLLFATLLCCTLAARAEEPVFITHPGTTESVLSTEDAKNILLGNLTKWRSGPPIKLVVLTESALHEQVIKDLTQRTPDQFEKFWIRRVFTGNGAMPAKAKTEAEIIAYVAANPGSFGYVDKASATPQVKILTLK